MALYIPHSIFHLARLLYVRPETSGPYYVHVTSKTCVHSRVLRYLAIYEETTKKNTVDPKRNKMSPRACDNRENGAKIKKKSYYSLLLLHYNCHTG